MKEYWLYQLTVTDRTNIVCFCIFMVISAICTLIAIGQKRPLAVLWILFMDVLGVLLLITRLTVNPHFLSWP